MKLHRTLASLCAAGLLANCNGPGQQTMLPARAHDASANVERSASLIIRIHIPQERLRQRHAKYISAATKAITLAFFGASKFTRVIDLTRADPRCSGSPLTCTISVALKAGKYLAKLRTYDEAPVHGAIPSGAKLLSTATRVALSVKRGKANALKVTLDGVPASFVIGGFPDATAGTGFLDAPFSVTAKDAGGFTIVGTYATPVTLSDTDTGHATVIATKGADFPPAGKLTSSSDIATMSYTGKAIAPVTIVASAGAVIGDGLFAVHNPIYVADYSDNAVKEVPPGCAVAACVTSLGGGFNHPAAVAADGSGNVFVADAANNAIKKIPLGCVSAGCVTTLGGGFNDPQGVAVDSAGNVFVGDTPNSAVKKIPPNCLTALCVTELGGGFNYPGGVGVDAGGDVLVADELGKAVKKIPPGCVSSTCVKTLGGGFSEPVSVVADRAGNVYVADYTANAVKKIPPGCTASTCVSTLGGGFGNPYGTAVDGFGNIFVGDASNNALKEIPVGCNSSGCVLTLGGGFNAPFGVATL